MIGLSIICVGCAGDRLHRFGASMVIDTDARPFVGIAKRGRVCCHCNRRIRAGQACVALDFTGSRRWVDLGGIVQRVDEDPFIQGRGASAN